MSLYRSSVELLDRVGIAGYLRPGIGLVRGQKRHLKRLSIKLASKKRIQEYLEQHDCRKLHLGASNKVMAGWLNTDVEPMMPAIVYLDCEKTFPLGSAAIDFAFCEHFIEHLDRETGLSCMRETYRCLKPGGVFRVATPDLSKFIGLFSQPLELAQQRYLEQFRLLLGLDSMTPCRALNLVMHSWGHKCLYTREELTEALSLVGFSDIRSVKVGESRHDALRDLERHQEFCGEEMNSFETMVLEAVK